MRLLQQVANIGLYKGPVEGHCVKETMTTSQESLGIQSVKGTTAQTGFSASGQLTSADQTAESLFQRGDFSLGETQGVCQRGMCKSTQVSDRL